MEIIFKDFQQLSRPCGHPVTDILAKVPVFHKWVYERRCPIFYADSDKRKHSGSILTTTEPTWG